MSHRATRGESVKRKYSVAATISRGESRKARIEAIRAKHAEHDRRIYSGSHKKPF